MDEVRRYQLARWREALRADAAGEVVVLDGDPFKLYYAYARRALGETAAADWDAEVALFRRLVGGDDTGWPTWSSTPTPATRSSPAAARPTPPAPAATSPGTPPCGRPSAAGTKA